eukprot:1195013-Prorocentrum_minimum.AAC.7
MQRGLRARRAIGTTPARATRSAHLRNGVVSTRSRGERIGNARTLRLTEVAESGALRLTEVPESGRSTPYRKWPPRPGSQPRLNPKPPEGVEDGEDALGSSRLVLVLPVVAFGRRILHHARDPAASAQVEVAGFPGAEHRAGQVACPGEHGDPRELGQPQPRRRAWVDTAWSMRGGVATNIMPIGGEAQLGKVAQPTYQTSIIGFPGGNPGSPGETRVTGGNPGGFPGKTRVSPGKTL